MLVSKHNFVLAIRDASGKEVYRGVAGSLQPCYEDLLFSAVVARKVPNDGALLSALIEPVWTLQQRLAGVRLSFGGFRKFYGRRVFANPVWSALIASHLLTQREEEDTSFSWEVEVERKNESEKKARFLRSVTRAPYPLSEASPADYGIQVEARESEALPVYVSKGILAGMAKETVNSLDRERADFLTGHLLWDGQGRVSVVVDGRIPAKMEASASNIHFAFSAATFHAAQQDLAAAGRDAVIVGWHHNHPPACGRECLKTEPPCATKTVFFSPNDRVVHWTSFPAPYMVALVSGKDRDRRADDPVFRAFGWRDGVIEERAFVTF